MVLLNARWRPGGEVGRRMAWSLVTVLALVLGGCSSSIEAYRSLSGIDKNDPDQSAPFTRNMADAYSAAYPNLANVPPPPTRATTAAERQKLQQSLVADRTATAAAMGQAPVASAPSAAATRGAKAASGPLPATPAAPMTAGAATAPVTAAAASAPPLAASSAVAAPSVPAPGNSKLASNTHQTGWRKSGEPPDPVAPESTLQMPDVRSVPEPEAMRPPPPAPVLPAVARPAVVPEPSGALAAGTPEPAPPVPVIAPVAPPPVAAKPAPKQQSFTVVARLELPAAGAPPGHDQAQIDRVAALHAGQSAMVRVVGYAAAPATGNDPLSGYRAALDRAQQVAKALAVAGIPAAKIQTEAMPVAGPGAGGHIEIQFAQ